MPFTPIDFAVWKRTPYYRHYMDTVRCTYSVTVAIDVAPLAAALKAHGLRAYPAQIFMLARAVNLFPEFRMALDSQGTLGCWEISHPGYAIFNKKAETFSSICTAYLPEFGAFYHNCIQDMATYREAEVLFPQAGMPENLFTVSSLPWLGFSGFNINVHGDGAYLPPIFTIGRYLQHNGRKHMPLAIQVHHAVCDGYHVGKFTEAVQDMASHPGQWM